MQTNLERAIGEPDHDRCRILLKQTECKSRFEFSTCRKQLRNRNFCQEAFQLRVTKLYRPIIDLFNSRLCHKLMQYLAWELNLNSIRTNTTQQNWNISLRYAFSPLGVISQVLAKAVRKKVNYLIIVNLVQSTLVCSTALHVKNIPDSS